MTRNVTNTSLGPHGAAYLMVVDLPVRRQCWPGETRAATGQRACVCAPRRGGRFSPGLVPHVRVARRLKAVECVSKPDRARRPGVSAAVRHPPTPAHSGVTRTV